MICLENRTFAVSQTTKLTIRNKKELLWFAWKIVLLQYRKQLVCLFISKALSCDLLGKSYFCSIANNIREKIINRMVVVICLENRTFAVSQTTQGILVITYVPLWFAWKIVLLQYRKQRARTISNSSSGCDLLGKSYFCSIANNRLAKIPDLSLVVICLENRTFAVSQTTSCWRLARRWCCDLLGKSYFCSIANN